MSLEHVIHLRLILYRDLLATLKAGKLEMLRKKIQGMVEEEVLQLERIKDDH
ncbi:MAG: hypothetical protein V3S69_05940 [Dehalococcoidales bacterium]